MYCFPILLQCITAHYVHYSTLQRAGEEVGLAISKSKTKNGFEETEPVINLDGEIVEAVNHFRYLGSEVMPSGRLGIEDQDWARLRNIRTAFQDMEEQK